ncbi:MAG: hypothetical protein COA43_05445 [Robiginitomaculum sp.]|nr:MAG: hypothetical protein COA43_05445 [Robiginitomaculum sp.]
MLKPLKFIPLLAMFGTLVSCATTNNQTSYINTSDPILTMVNVLTPTSVDQNAAIAQMQKAFDTTLVYQPGFISGNILKSLDSDHIVTYAQWEDEAALKAFVKKLQSGNAPEMAQAFSITKPDYHPYKVVSVHRPVTK